MCVREREREREEKEMNYTTQCADQSKFRSQEYEENKIASFAFEISLGLVHI